MVKKVVPPLRSSSHAHTLGYERLVLIGDPFRWGSPPLTRVGKKRDCETLLRLNYHLENGTTHRVRRYDWQVPAFHHSPASVWHPSLPHLRCTTLNRPKTTDQRRLSRPPW